MQTCCDLGAGTQGPAGVRTDYPPLENENNGIEDLEFGNAERPEGIVGPEGVACKVLHAVIDLPRRCYSAREAGSQHCLAVQH